LVLSETVKTAPPTTVVALGTTDKLNLINARQRRKIVEYESLQTILGSLLSLDYIKYNTYLTSSISDA
jgi:hypothetical protein